MKRIITKAFMLLCVMMMTTGVYAYDFQKEGFYYRITDKEGSLVNVTSGDVKYSGNIEIPTVVEIGRAHV